MALHRIPCIWSKAEAYEDYDTRRVSQTTRFVQVYPMQYYDIETVTDELRMRDERAVGRGVLVRSIYL
jgi:hypothetical protein